MASSTRQVFYSIERQRGSPLLQEALAQVDEPPVTVIDVDRKLAFPAGAGQTKNFAGVCR